jgi:hypothetical protein
MSPYQIQTWVSKKKKQDLAANYGLAAASLVSGVIVLFITFWVTYGVIYVAADGFSAVSNLLANFKFQIVHSVRLIFSGVFVLALFLQYLRTNPEYWREYPTDEKDFGLLMKETLGDYRVLSPILSHPKTVSKGVADVLLTGPRLVFGSWGRIKQAQQLKGMDETICAEALALIYSRPDAVPYEELCSKGWGRSLAALKTWDGVYFLEAGLLLSDELRTEFTNLSVS